MNKFIISSTALAPALKKLSQAINRHNVVPALTNLMVKASAGEVVFIASDLEVTIHYRVDAECKEAFEFLVPFEFLSKIVSLNKNMPLTFELGKSLKIQDDKDVYTVKSPEPVANFPKLQEMPKKKSFDINQDIIIALHTALSTTGNTNYKPASAFVLLEVEPGKLTVASSDNMSMVYSLQFASEVDDKQEILLSSKIIRVLDGCTEAKVFYHDKIVGFVAGDITIINTRTELKYGDFRKVFPPEWPANLKINRYDLLNALMKCSLSSDELRTTNVELTTTEMKLLADDGIITANPSVQCEYTGDVPQTIVNSDKLTKLLQQVEYGEINIAIHDRNRPVVLSATENKGYLAMIMPIAQLVK